VPDALAINAYYLQQAQGGRHVLLIGDKKGHNCGFSIRKSRNVKPTVYWGKAVLLSYEISAPRTLLPPNNNYRDTDPLPAHLKPVMPAIKWMTGEDHTVFTNPPGPCIPTLCLDLMSSGIVFHTQIVTDSICRTIQASTLQTP